MSRSEQSTKPSSDKTSATTTSLFAQRVGRRGSTPKTPFVASGAQGAYVLSPEVDLAAHTAPLAGEELSSCASSDDYHQFARLFGGAEGDGMEPAEPTAPMAVEVLDEFGDLVAPQPSVSAEQPSRWSNLWSRGIAVVSRLMIGESVVPDSAPKQVAPHDPFASEESMMRYACNPKELPLQIVRDIVLAHSDAHRAAANGSHTNSGTPSFARKPLLPAFQWEEVHNGGQQPYGDDDDEGQDFELDLIGAMQRYVSMPCDFNGNLVLAALATRDPVNDPVVYEELCATCGNEFLIDMVLQSGALPVQVDARIDAMVQAYADAALVPSSNGRLDPSRYAHLRCLLQVPSVRLSSAQTRLMRQSGFEFVVLLLEFPYLEQPETTADSWLRGAQSFAGRRLDFFFAVLGLVLVCFDFASLTLVTQYWYFQSSGYAYTTMLCYVAGYVLDIVAMLFVVRNKATSSVYEGRITAFPSVNLKVFPLVPVYDIVLFQSIVRHEWDAWKSRGETSGGRNHAAMIHDLYATSTLVRLSHSLCYSVPQAIMQSYFFDWGTLGEGSLEYFGYKLVLASSVACVLFALLLFMRQLVVFDSVSYLGYASFGSEQGRIIDRRSVVPRTISLVLILLFEVNIFFLIIGAQNVERCSTNTIVWISFASGVLASCFIIFVASVRSNKEDSAASCGAQRWFLVPIVLQGAFTVFMAVRRASTVVEECTLFRRAGTTLLIIGYASWGLFFVLGVLWFLSSKVFDKSSERMDERPRPPTSFVDEEAPFA